MSIGLAVALVGLTSLAMAILLVPLFVRPVVDPARARPDVRVERRVTGWSIGVVSSVWPRASLLLARGVMLRTTPEGLEEPA